MYSTSSITDSQSPPPSFKMLDSSQGYSKT